MQAMKILSNMTDAFDSKSMGCLCFNSICTCSNADPSKSHLKEMMRSFDELVRKNIRCETAYKGTSPNEIHSTDKYDS